MAAGHKTGGRTAGTPNKVTTAFKNAVRIVYDDIGGHEAFAAWARENPGDFYRIASRLIPTEIETSRDSGLTIVIQQADGSRVPMAPRVYEGESMRDHALIAH